MKTLSEETLESINSLCCKENNVEFDANGDTLYSFANLLSVTTEALTNPSIYTKADLISKEDTLGFCLWCTKSGYDYHESFNIWVAGIDKKTTEELFNIYQQTK